MYLPEYKWWNEALHGMASTDCCPPYQYENVTVFPQVIGLSMSWNRTLWSEIGDIIGTEALQKVHDDSTTETNKIHPGVTFFTPNINIFRDPRWGRGQETPGEDPFLTSHYAAVMIMSLQYGKEFLKQQLYDQSNTEDHRLKQPRIAATCKHFAAYSLETDRLNFSADIQDQRDWDDTYFPAFDACIHAESFLYDYFGMEDRGDLNGGAMGTMCSYNAINGLPSCANPKLLQNKLRKEWGYSGYVVSDCWAIHNIYENHHYASSFAEAVGMAIRAGVDLDCGDTVQKYGLEALEKGYMDVEDVDRALSNLFGVLVDVGYFDSGEKLTKTTRLVKEDVLQVKNHNQVALEAAQQSIVLLKNGDDGYSPKATQTLPLSSTRHKKVTLIGPLADEEDLLLGNYHGKPTKVTTPRRGLEDFGVDVEYIQGCNVTGGSAEHSDNEQKEDLCQHISDDSDATILVMGLSQDIESEGIDRTTLLLPKGQRDVIDEASGCSKANRPNTPVILVVIAGGAVDLSSYKMNDNIDAILYTSYPGQAGGQALAKIIYGQYNPSGRLVTTIYQNSYLEEVSLEDMRMRPHDGLNLYPGRTYRFYTGSSVVYPFGYGLSYSSWVYSIDNLVSSLTLNVTNVGPLDGSNSVLLFHQGPNTGKDGNPNKSLIGFEKVFVSVGSSQTVKFSIEKWMSSQEDGTHTFLIGPSLEYALQIAVG